MKNPESDIVTILTVPVPHPSDPLDFGDVFIKTFHALPLDPLFVCLVFH